MREELEKYTVVGAGFGLVASGKHPTSRSNGAKHADSEKQLRRQLGGSGIAVACVIECRVMAALIDGQQDHQQQRAGGVGKSGLCSGLGPKRGASA